jgi:hypothetical protein
MVQQTHQVAHLISRTLPVLAGKGVKCQHFQPKAGCGFDHAAHRFHPFPVTGNARQPLGLCPTAIAIHDDGKMPAAAGRAIPHRGGN